MKSMSSMRAYNVLELKFHISWWYCVSNCVWEFILNELRELSRQHEMDYHELEASQIHTIFKPIEILQLTTWTSDVYPQCFKLNIVAHNIHHYQCSYFPTYGFVIYKENRFNIHIHIYIYVTIYHKRTTLLFVYLVSYGLLCHSSNFSNDIYSK